MEFIKNFIQEEDGVTAIEYGLIAALIAVVIIAAVRTIGVNLDVVFDTIGNALTPVGDGGDGGGAGGEPAAGG